MTSLGADEGEDLEDGSRSVTPDGDNLRLDYARAEAAAYGELVRSSGGRVDDTTLPAVHLRDLGVGTPFGNLALLSTPVTGGEAANTIAEIRDWFGRGEGGPFLIFSPWRTDDWRDHGLNPVGHPPLMLRPPGAGPVPAQGVTVERVADGEVLAQWERTFLHAYPVPEMLPAVRGSFVGPEVLGGSWTFFLGRVEGHPAASSAAYVTPTLNVVEMVSVLPDHRGRQLGTALSLAAATVAPDRPSMLIASDLGRGVYARLGYLPLLRYTLWLGERP